jgi:hypothetical protein
LGSHFGQGVRGAVRVSVTDLPMEEEADSDEVARLGKPPDRRRQASELVPGIRLTGRITDSPAQLEHVLQVVQGCQVVSFVQINRAEVVPGHGFSSPVADLLPHRQRLAEHLPRRFALTMSMRQGRQSAALCGRICYGRGIEPAAILHAGN